MVEGNYIGTDPSGMSAIPNLGDGVYLGSGTTGNLIGGTVPGAGNTIAYNTLDGVAVSVPVPLATPYVATRSTPTAVWAST